MGMKFINKRFVKEILVINILKKDLLYKIFVKY